MPRLHLFAALGLAVVLGACASATDRFEEGLAAESAGRYYEASMRYVDALDKDRDLTSARDRLMITGDSAIREGVRSAENRLALGDPVGAGDEFLSLDRLMNATRGVGVRLPTPSGFLDQRRSVFDDAIQHLMDLAADGHEGREWQTARRALNRLQADFEPDAGQRQAAHEAEARLVLAWAEDEEYARRYRSAFDLAGELLAMGGSAPRVLADEAEALQQRALEQGTRFLAVFPVDMDPDIEGWTEEDPRLLLSDALELDHWRQPPAFVAVADPVLVRRLTRRYAPPGTPLRPRRILEEVRADYGALIEIILLTRSERNVRSTVRTATNSDGGTVRYDIQEGTQRYEVRVRVSLMDASGRPLDDFQVSDNVSGPFRRAVYDGDPRELDLSRSQRMLFDPVPQAEARAQMEVRLTTELAERIAEQVFRRVLRRVP